METSAPAIGGESAIEAVICFNAQSLPFILPFQQQRIAGPHTIIGSGLDEESVTHPAQKGGHVLVLAEL